MSVSGDRTFGLITFDNSGGYLPATLNIDTNGTGGTTDRTLTINTGITLQNTTNTVVFRGSNAALTVSLSGPATFTTSAGSTLQFNSAVNLTSSSRLTKEGPGTLTLNGSTALNGGITINDGLLRIGAGLAMGALPGSATPDRIILNGGTLEYFSGSNFNSGVNRGFSIGDNDGTISVTGAGELQISAAIVDLTGQSGRLTKTGAGVLILSSSSSAYSGGVTVLDGTLRFSFNAGLGSLPGSYVADQVVLNGGTLAYNGGGATSASNRGFSIGDNGGGISVSNSGDYQINGIIANVAGQTGGLNKTGPGTLVLNPGSANTYSGGTTVSSGTLVYGRTGSLGTAGVQLGVIGGGDAALLNNLGGWNTTNDIVVAAGSGGALTLGYTGTADFSARFTGTITLNDHLTLLSNSATGFAMRMEGAISGGFNLTKTGSGTVRFENDNMGYSGMTTISNGLLQVGNAGTSGGLGSGDVVNNAVLSVNRSNTYALNNQISGTGSFEQTGSGVTVLSNANTYSGGTVVSAGSLIVTNTTGSGTGTGSLSTASGTSLMGTGFIAPTASNDIEIGGEIAPGLAAEMGTLTFNTVSGGMVFLDTASLAFRIGLAGVSDHFVFSSSSGGLLDFSALTLGSIQVGYFSGYTPSLHDAFTLFSWSGMTGLSTSHLSSLPTDGFDEDWFWDTSLFTTQGIISIAQIPEPGRAVLLLVGGLLMSLRRRRVW